MSNRVYVVCSDKLVQDMFLKRGWTLAPHPSLADLICFTGGADVSPSLYNQENTGLSHCNKERDEYEVKFYLKNLGANMVGICRGGQFLNVMNGGSMIQDIPFHGGHRRVLLDTGEQVSLHEDHHQGIVPGPGATIIGVDVDSLNYEIVAYDGVLCFQAHPEWGCQVTENLFFTLIEEYFS